MASVISIRPVVDPLGPHGAIAKVPDVETVAAFAISAKHVNGLAFARSFEEVFLSTIRAFVEIDRRSYAPAIDVSRRWHFVFRDSVSADFRFVAPPDNCVEDDEAEDDSEGEKYLIRWKSIKRGHDA